VKTLCPLWNLWFSIQLRFGLVLLCINSITCNGVIRQSKTQKWFRKTIWNRRWRNQRAVNHL